MPDERDRRPRERNATGKQKNNLGRWIMPLLAILLLIAFLSSGITDEGPSISYTQLRKEIAKGNVP